MADFTPLSEAERQALAHHDHFARQRRRLKLLRLAARARLRLVAVHANRLDPARAHDARGLALLADRAAQTYQRLGPLTGAIRFAASVARRALRATGLAAAERAP